MEQGYEDEVDWQEKLDFHKITEKKFIEELAWVILNSGMREKVIRAKFFNISNAFYQWDTSVLNLHPKCNIFVNSSFCKYFNRHFKTQLFSWPII